VSSLDHSVELLAPAGGPRSLVAAVANGANAVYLGVEVFNARRGAENFTIETLMEACTYAHLRGVRVYLTVNVLILSEELERALRLVDSAWAAGVDAVIVQDMGLLRAICESLPEVRVHASTQLNTHNSATAEVLASFGVSRVTLAREVSSDEVARIVKVTDVEVECFIHGALCVCYSGQCLMSSLIGRRSANRGLCAQPCRLPYDLLGGAGEKLSDAGPHPLSPKDLAGLTALPGLLASGVHALKIEGRMKSPAYVALTVGVYRAAIDRALADPAGFSATDADWSVLAESFSRGFSVAYLDGIRDNELMSYQRPNNRGAFAGRVRSVDGYTATIALDVALESADTIEFWTSSGHSAQPAGVMEFDGAERSAAPAGALVAIRVSAGVAPGDRVFRVRNAALEEAAARSFADPVSAKPVPLDFEVRLREGKPLQVTVRDERGREGTALGDIVGPARTKEVAADEVLEHVGRLGGTPYLIRDWSLELSPGVGVGYSTLHRVRREALAALETAILAPWAGRRREHPALPPLPQPYAPTDGPQLVARVADLACARACLDAGADRALVPLASLVGVDPLPEGVEAVLPRIAHDREVPGVLTGITPGSRVVVGNLGLLRVARHSGARVEADWSLNVVNPQSAAMLAQEGAELVWLSPELTGPQIADLARMSPIPVGVSVFGRQELMVTEHCILMAEGSCESVCGACPRRRSRRVLRDRKGYEFPVSTDVSGRSHVFNSVDLDLGPAVGEIVAAGVSALALDLGLESSETAAAHTRRFVELLRAGRKAAGDASRAPGSTSGHYYRGVL
jgi:U32 family peptidase